MTLQEWSTLWPYRLTLDNAGCYHTPDTDIVGSEIRDTAWRLEDAFVSSISGGSIWFCPRSSTPVGSYRREEPKRWIFRSKTS